MAKTIFKSTEKSNFIINMTEQQYSGLASKALFAMCLLVSLFTIPAECVEDIGFSIASAGLAISGVVCMILALIAVVKKFVDKKMLFPVAAYGVMLTWGIISLVDSYEIQVSFYGFNGRGEGLLALIFYFGFFLTALTIKREKALEGLLSGIIGAGVLNSVWALLQVFIPSMPSNYRHIVGAAKDVDAASGLAQSPIFLAMLLSLSLTAAIIGAVMSESKKKRIICLVSGCLFSFVMIFTYSLAGIVGLVFSAAAAVAAVVISGVSKARVASLAAIFVPAALAVVLVSTGVVGDYNSYKLRDGSVIWHDSFNRLSASGIFNQDVVDIDSTSDVYYFLNNKTIGIIERYPLTGTGPEQLVYPQIHSSLVFEENRGTFDKVYNEYLYTAATRGVISLIALAAALAGVFVISLKKLRKNKKSLTTVSFFFIFFCGIVLFMVGCSNIGFSPLFWAAAGASCAAIKPEKQVNPKKLVK